MSLHIFQKRVGQNRKDWEPYDYTRIVEEDSKPPTNSVPSSTQLTPVVSTPRSRSQGNTSGLFLSLSRLKSRLLHSMDKVTLQLHLLEDQLFLVRGLVDLLDLLELWRDKRAQCKPEFYHQFLRATLCIKQNKVIRSGNVFC